MTLMQCPRWSRWWPPCLLRTHPRLHFTAGVSFFGNTIDGTASIASAVGEVSTSGSPAVVNVAVAPSALP